MKTHIATGGFKEGELFNIKPATFKNLKPKDWVVTRNSSKEEFSTIPVQLDWVSKLHRAAGYGVVGYDIALLGKIVFIEKKKG